MNAFTIQISDRALDDLRVRLGDTRFPDALTGVGWDYGVDLEFLRRLITYWGQRFDWRAAEARLNAFPQFTTEIEGETVHFVHVKGRGRAPVPILLANGWPSNFIELLPMVERLRAEENGLAFDLVIPSLPGYGFSSRPRRPGMNLSRAAGLWSQLMSRLGYDRFLVSGSDLGAGVALSLLRNHPERLVGAHWCNVYSRYPRPDDPTPEENDYFAKVDTWTFAEGAYAMVQGTKPTTLSVGLNDSPAGLAAWIVEKFRTWGDTGGDVESVFPLDTLCTLLSVYWFTETIGSSVRMYKEAFADGEIMQPMPPHSVPQGVLVPAECDLPAPRAWAERHLQNLRRWTVVDRGGHFPALEIPDVYASDIRAFYREVASSGR